MAARWYAVPLGVALLLAYYVVRLPPPGRYVRLALRVHGGRPVQIPDGLLSLKAMREEVAKEILRSPQLPELENLKVNWDVKRALVVAVGGPQPADLAVKMREYYRAQYLTRLDKLVDLLRGAYFSQPLAAITVWQARHAARDPHDLKEQQARLRETLTSLDWEIRRPRPAPVGVSAESVDSLKASQESARRVLVEKKVKMAARVMTPAQLQKAEQDYLAATPQRPPFQPPVLERLDVFILDGAERLEDLRLSLWPSAIGLAMLVATSLLLLAGMRDKTRKNQP